MAAPTQAHEQAPSRARGAMHAALPLVAMIVAVSLLLAWAGMRLLSLGTDAQRAAFFFAGVLSWVVGIGYVVASGRKARSRTTPLPPSSPD
ncbi:MAG TPA: hypothetical protein VM370_05405 [Candidatus Thermoplasmatota archaeon]|nr:hypothetical protein [Candidatus Thermoplasmatota archaeon]